MTFPQTPRTGHWSRLPDPWLRAFAIRCALLTSLLSVGTRSDPVPEFDLAQ